MRRLMLLTADEAARVRTARLLGGRLIVLTDRAALARLDGDGVIDVLDPDENQLVRAWRNPHRRRLAMWAVDLGVPVELVRGVARPVAKALGELRGAPERGAR